MSFSSEIKEELIGRIPAARHCQIAELAALTIFLGKIKKQEGASGFSVEIETENRQIAKKYATLLKQTFSIKGSVFVPEEPTGKRAGAILLSIDRAEETQKLLQAMKLLDDAHDLMEREYLVSRRIVQNTCCKRAFIRGAFLAAGSMSSPERSYHFEIVCQTEKKAEQLKELINDFGLDSKITQRKKYYIVYLKEGSQIADILRVMEASVSIMNFENVRILKEMRNSVNRQVNCETANINKTVHAAVKQLEDIQYIQKKTGLETLPENLYQMAMLRLQYPEAPLKELGMLLNPTVGKSGVNHRLRKLSKIAEELREEEKK